MTNDDLIRKYEKESARLEASIDEMKATRRQMPWVLLGLLLAPLGLFAHWVVAAAIAVLLVAVVIIGTYLTTMHIYEDEGLLRQAREHLTQLRDPAR